MSEHRRNQSGTTVPQQVVRILECQRGPDDGSRAELLEALERPAGGTPEPDDTDLAELGDLLAESSLGDDPDDPWSGECDDVDDDEVARVLDRLDAAEGRDAGEPVPVGAVAAWTQELSRLIRIRPTADGVLGPLAGLPPRTGDGPAPPVRPTVLADRVLERPELAEKVVTALGESWDDSGFRGLYFAARRALSGGTEPCPWVSGLSMVRWPDRDAALARVAAPVDGLPTVRGRDAVVDRLVSTVEDGGSRVHVVLAPGGYGKTTVTLAVAAQARRSGRTVIRLPAADLEELVDGLYLAAVSTGATQRGLEHALDGEPLERAERLWTLLDASPLPWLIVLDDVGESVAGHPAWTRGARAGTVLLTTRYGDPSAWGGCDVTTLGRLDPDQGGLVLLDRLGLSRRHESAGRAARALSAMLGGVPLALTAVGRLASGHRAGEALLGSLLEQLARMGPTNPVSAVYEMGVGAGAGAGADDADADADADTGMRMPIRLLACFGPGAPLPAAVLDGHASVLGARAPSIPELVRTGLVDHVMTPDGSWCVTIHPALAELSRADPTFDDAETATVTRAAITLLNDRLGALDPGAPQNWPELRLLTPHVAELLDDPALTGELLAAAVELGERCGSALLYSGDAATASALLADAWRLSAPLGERHPARLAMRHARARETVLDGGDFALAERELREVHALRAEVLGEHDPATLATRDYLSWVVAERGDPDLARRMTAEVLAVRRELLGETHPDTLAARHRLAWIDALVGRERDARTGLADVRDQRVGSLGEDHLDVYNTRYRLAWTMARTWDFGGAEAEYRRLQADLEDVVGAEHPLTLKVRVRVGWVLAWRNRLDEAERCYRDALADQEKVLGHGHPRVLRTRHLMACLALNSGDVGGAIEQLRSVLREREDVLGPDHPHTLDSRSYLAWAWLQAGHTEAADREYQAIVSDRERVLGPTHPVTFHTRYLLVRARMRRGRLDEAQQLARRLLDDERAALPADHRLLLDARHTLAVVTGRRGRFATAEHDLRSVLADRIRLLGAEHRDTLATRDYLAWVLGRQGRVGDGLQVARSVLADRTRLLGSRHPHTLTSRYRLAWLTAATADRGAASILFTALLGDLREVLGDEHPDTLRCRHALVVLRRETGDLAVAEQEALALHAVQERVRGTRAVDTLRTEEELGLILLALPGRECEGEALLDDVLARRALLLGDDHPDTAGLRARRTGR